MIFVLASGPSLFLFCMICIVMALGGPWVSPGSSASQCSWMGAMEHTQESHRPALYFSSHTSDLYL